MQLSVQGYLQQRKHLNSNIFPHPNRRYLMDFYHSDEPILWKEYLLTAIDGNKAEAPHSKGNIREQWQPAFQNRTVAGADKRDVECLEPFLSGHCSGTYFRQRKMNWQNEI